MAQTNFTPILLYASSTPTNVPLAANLTNSATGSEIAINIADKNLFFKDSGGTVNTVPIRQSSTSSNGWLSSTDWNTFNGKAPATSGASILYGNGSGGFSNVTIGSGLTFAGGTLSATGGGGTVTSVTGTGTVNGLTLTGTVTTSGSLTLGGTLDLSSPPAIGGTTPNTITGSTINANTKVVSPDYYAQSVLGGNLRTSGGTSLLNWDGGGSGNVTINGGLLANPANKNVSIAPTGTGTVTVNPATAGTMNNMVIGGTTPLAITGTTITATTFSGSGASLTSIPNSALNNSSITINGTPVSLGGSTTVTASAGGSNTQIQYNNGGSFAGVPLLTYNGTTLAMTGSTIDNTVIGGTTPAAGTFTTIIGQTEVLKGTGQNLLTYSQDFTNATWTKSNLTAAITSATTDPLGGLTADILTPNGTTDAYCRQTITPVLSTFYGYSVYAKAGTGNWLRLRALFINNNTTDEAWFNLSTGTLGTVQASVTATITSVGNGWYRCALVGSTINVNSASLVDVAVSNADNTRNNTSGQTIYVWGAQLELSTTVGAYIATTSSVVYGTPTLSFSGVAGLGLQSDGSLYVSPAGTGALQAQATTSSTVGGNARGANAVDWQTSRGNANQVASSSYATLSGGNYNRASGFGSTVSGGEYNTATGVDSVSVGGNSNQVTQSYSFVGAGLGNQATGVMNFIGGGRSNSGTANGAVTTQATTSFTSGSTAVTLSGSNAAIKVGQYITGTGINTDTYVAAISGTSLTLSQNATATGTPTLSFYTPHGVVVGGGNNQATGSYSFIGGGGDAGTAANRNQAAGDWGVIGGGLANTIIAGSNYSFIGGGNGNQVNTAVPYGTVAGGNLNKAGQYASTVAGGVANNASGPYSFIAGGYQGTTRSIAGNHVFSACSAPIAFASGVSQAGLLVLGRQTTDATATVLTSDSNAANTTNQVILPNNSAYYFKASIISGVTGGGNSKAWTIEGLIKRGANAGSTALVGTPVVNTIAQDSGASTWAISATADTTNGGLAITFTGQASTTIRTVCKVETTEMTY